MIHFFLRYWPYQWLTDHPRLFHLVFYFHLRDYLGFWCVLYLFLAVDRAKISFFAERIKFVVLFRQYLYWDQFLALWYISRCLLAALIFSLCHSGWVVCFDPFGFHWCMLIKYCHKRLNKTSKVLIRISWRDIQYCHIFWHIWKELLFIKFIIWSITYCGMPLSFYMWNE